ncbi:MAG: NAD-dependent epimerase/dehydratase family protein [Candidatus Levybacteria bacterium]|nr:NAD-dependent epimerase/dehydratase family protein [Candidatus Levybacteria bacterium]
MKRILVTGGAGLIGSHLCGRLLSKGHKVICVDNLITGDKKNINSLLQSPNFKFIEFDITKDISTLNSLPRRQAGQLSTLNYIYHLACPTGVPNLVTLAEEMLLTCSIGTRNVLELARKTKAKLIFVSSSEVYGDPEIFPQSEEYTGNVDPIGIRSPYEEGKRFAESLVMMYVRKYNVDARIVRVFNTYGQCVLDKDSRVIPKFLRQIKTSEPLTVEGRGEQTRTFCYVDDLVDGLILVLNKGLAGEVYNIGSDREIRIIDLAKLMIKITKSKSKIKFVKRPTHDHKRRLPDLAKIKKLGWRSNIDLKIGILKTIQ